MTCGRPARTLCTAAVLAGSTGRNFAGSWAFALIGALAGALGGFTLEAADLTRAVPSDCLFYFHYRSSEDGDFHASLKRFGSSLRRAQVFEPLQDVFHSGLVEMQKALQDRAPEKSDERVRKLYEQEMERLEREIRVRRLDGAELQKILERVEWWKLFAREAVIAARLEGKRREWLAGFDAGRERDERLLELQEVLYGVAAVVPGLQLLISQRADGDALSARTATEGRGAVGGEVAVTVLYNVFDSAEEICLGGAGNLVLISTSRSLMRRALRLLGGEGGEIALAVTPDYARAVGALREDFEKAWAPKVFPDSQLPGEGFQLVIKPGAFLPELGLLKEFELFVAAGDAIDGEIRGSSTARFAPTALAGDVSLFRRAFLEQPGLDDLTLSLPPRPAWFEVASGSRPELLLDFLLELAKQFAPGGEAIAERLESENIYLELRDGFFPALTGRRVLARAAGQDVSQYVGVWELREPVAKSVDAWTRVLTKLEEAAPGAWTVPELTGPQLAGQGGTTGSGGTGALRRLSLPAPYNLVLPAITVGVVADSFVVASSEAALQAVLENAGREGIDLSSYAKAPPAELQRVSFGERPTFLGVLRAALGLSPLWVELAVQDKRAQAFLRPFVEVAVRLGGALEELDSLGGPKTALTVRKGDSLVGAMRAPVRAR